MLLNIYWVRGLNKKYSEAKDYLTLNIDSSKVKQMHPTDHFMMTSPCQLQECREDSAGRAPHPPGHAEGLLPTPCGHLHLAAYMQA